MQEDSTVLSNEAIFHLLPKVTQVADFLATRKSEQTHFFIYLVGLCINKHKWQKAPWKIYFVYLYCFFRYAQESSKKN